MSIAYKLVALIVGIGLLVIGINETRIYLSGESMDLNTATMEDFSEKNVVEGDIACVDTQFAVIEEKSKALGFITTSTKQTYYYMVESLTSDQINKYLETGEYPKGAFVYVVSVSSEELRKQFDENIDGWNDFFDEETETIPEPVHFEGRLWEQPTDDDYKNFRSDALKDMGIEDWELAELKAMDSRPDKTSFVLIIIGVVGLLYGAGGIIIPIMKKKKMASGPRY